MRYATYGVLQKQLPYRKKSNIEFKGSRRTVDMRLPVAALVVGRGDFVYLVFVRSELFFWVQKLLNE